MALSMKISASNIKTRVIPSLAVLLVGFVIVLIVGNYNSQVALRQSALQGFGDNVWKQSKATAQFYVERMHDMEYLQVGKELSGYFENLSLGMSEEYGLWASVVSVNRFFYWYVRYRKIHDRNIYQRILFVKSDGSVLADSNVQPGASREAYEKSNYKAYTSVAPVKLFKERLEGKNYMVMTVPYHFGQEYVGNIVAWLDIGSFDLNMLVHVASMSGQLSYLVYEDSILSNDLIPEELRDILASPVQKEGETVKVDFRQPWNGTTEFFFMRVGVKGVPMSIASMVPRSSVAGGPNPVLLLALSMVAAILVIGGGLAAVRSYARTLELRVRVDEGAKREGEVMRANTMLKEQMRLGRRREDELSMANSLLQSLINAMPDPLYYKGLNGLYLGCNEAFAKLVGRDRETIIGWDGCKVQSGTQTLAFCLGDKEAMDENRPCATEEIFVNPDGQVMNMETIRTPYRDHKGRTIGIIGISRDVTERTRVQEELERHRNSLEDLVGERTKDLRSALEGVKESERLMLSIMEGIRAAILIVDPKEFLVVDMNTVAEEMFMVQKKDYIGKKCYSLACQGKDKCRTHCPLMESNLREQEMLLERSDGTIIPVIKTVISGQFMHHLHLIEVIFDMSDRKALERQLTQAQKLESVGQLAAGIAHEINTPIQYVGDNIRFFSRAYGLLAGLVDALLKLYDETRKAGERSDLVAAIENELAQSKLDFIREEIPNAIEQAIEGVERVSVIVQGMKKFSHPDVEEKKPVDINAAIENTVLIAKNEWKYVSEVKMDTDPDLPVVMGLPGDINQVILNLLVNAAHAVGDVVGKSGEKGLITISTRSRGPNVEIRVKDTGSGIPEENRSKIFDPFFTTKAVGKGTGQGLAITHSIIVQKHGGTIDFRTKLGEGTTFVIVLPTGEPKP